MSLRSLAKTALRPLSYVFAPFIAHTACRPPVIRACVRRGYLLVPTRINLDDLERISPHLAPLIELMAKTGIGTNECLKVGALPMQVHFYSPVPDIHDLERRGVWDRRSKLEGVDFRPEWQEQWLLRLGGEFGNECDWPLAPAENPAQFHTENDTFSYGCAAGLHGMIRHFKPRRILEIGSGNSSKVISAALTLNTRDGLPPCEYTIVDPYPSDWLERGLPNLQHLVKERVETIGTDLFDQLAANDILMIDSGHTVRIGGDVNFLILDVLPRLAPGVVVHFHDIGLPREYPKTYATNPNFRMFWTEAYLLQAFLSLNDEFEVMLAMNYLMTDRKETFCKAFRHYDPQKNKAISGSFWIRRKPAQGSNHA